MRYPRSLTEREMSEKLMIRMCIWKSSMDDHDGDDTMMFNEQIIKMCHKYIEMRICFVVKGDECAHLKRGKCG